jgi:hypothetical protein
MEASAPDGKTDADSDTLDPGGLMDPGPEDPGTADIVDPGISRDLGIPDDGVVLDDGGGADGRRDVEPDVVADATETDGVTSDVPVGETVQRKAGWLGPGAVMHGSGLSGAAWMGAIRRAFRVGQ